MEHDSVGDDDQIIGSTANHVRETLAVHLEELALLTGLLRHGSSGTTSLQLATEGDRAAALSAIRWLTRTGCPSGGAAAKDTPEQGTHSALDGNIVLVDGGT